MSGIDIPAIESIILAAKRNALTMVRIRQGETTIWIEMEASMSGGSMASAESHSPVSADVLVKSQLVGYFHRPEHVAEEGQRVDPDTPVGVIEALGLPNEVLAGVSGTLEEILVEEGAPVEYGQAIARVKIT